MFQSQRLVSKTLLHPYFIEVVADPRALTVRLYDEVVAVAPPAETPDAVVEQFVGLHRQVAYRVPAGLRFESPAGRHPSLVDGERWPMRVPGSEPRGIVHGAEFSPAHAGRLFIEIAASTLDRESDPGVTPDWWTDAGEWLFDLDANGRLSAPYNKNLFTRDRHVRGTRFAMMFGRTPILRLFQPFKKTPLDACSMYLAVHQAVGFHASGTPAWTENPGRHADMTKLIPALRWANGNASEVASDGSASLVIECVDPVTGNLIAVDEGEVSIEADSGYLPVRKCTLRKGVAELRISAKDLPKGHKVRVSAGFDSAPSRLHAELTIV